MSAYTQEQFAHVLSKASDLVTDALSLSESETDLIELLINTANTLAVCPEYTFDDVLSEHYDGTDVRTWWDWTPVK